MNSDEIEMIEGYRAAVVKTFAEVFAAEAGRFPEGQRLLRRFNEAIDYAMAVSPQSAMSEAHNEMCVARALLLNTKPRFSTLAYEPALPGCAKSIDFCGVSTDGLCLYVDVKTISPVPTDRWGQFEEAQREKWFPDNVRVGLFEDWMGGGRNLARLDRRARANAGIRTRTRTKNQGKRSEWADLYEHHPRSMRNGVSMAREPA